MYKMSRSLTFTVLLALAFALVVNAQDTKVTMNADGSYSVIEYPVGKEVTVNLMPVGSIRSKGMARVMRMSDGTKVYFDLTGAPTDWTNVYAYAVDPMGAATFLGPITFSNGTGKAEFMTPGDQFMLVLSPKEGLTTYDPTGTYYFRSEVPACFKIMPRGNLTRVSTMTTSNDSATMTTTTTTTYDVPMLGIAQHRGK